MHWTRSLGPGEQKAGQEDMMFGCQDPNEMEAKAENQIVGMPVAALHSMKPTDDPFDEALKPPVDESPEDRELRIAREDEARRVSLAIDASIKAERQARRKKRIVRLLLLGQSESGKSTTLRQFQRLYTPTAFREERILWRAVIQLNILLHLHFLFGEIVGALQQAQTFSLSRRRSCGTFQFLADGGVRRGLKKKKIRLEVFPGLFLNDLERITSPKYVRTNDCRRVGGLIRKAGFAGREIENSRRQASIIFKKLGYHSLMMASSQFQFCFRPSAHSASQTVDAIIFLAPISGFDQVLSEDRTVNRLVRAPELSSYPRLIAGLQEDSVLLWKAVCQNKLLANVDLVLFLNKCDILESKLKAGIRLSKYVRSYGDRENDLDTVSKYLRSKFNAIHREYSPNPRKFYAFCTSVTDTATTAGIIASVRDMVIRQHLKQSKLL
ncbi:guanine nucleotide binding protein, alpha subunit [Armillaria fumosa]|nr:guanine nucleotide binding protein, alpha subunit [Armillaria fumosa]